MRNAARKNISQISQKTKETAKYSLKNQKNATQIFQISLEKKKPPKKSTKALTWPGTWNFSLQIHPQLRTFGQDCLKGCFFWWCYVFYSIFVVTVFVIFICFLYCCFLLLFAVFVCICFYLLLFALFFVVVFICSYLLLFVVGCGLSVVGCWLLGVVGCGLLVVGCCCFCCCCCSVVAAANKWAANFEKLLVSNILWFSMNSVDQNQQPGSFLAMEPRWNPPAYGPTVWSLLLAAMRLEVYRSVQ